MKHTPLAIGLLAVGVAALIGCGGSSLNSGFFGSNGHVRGVNLLYYGDRIDFLGDTNSVTGGTNLALGSATPYDQYTNTGTYFNFRNPTNGNVGGNTFTPTLDTYDTVYGVRTATGYDAFHISDNSGGVTNSQAKIRLVYGYSSELPVDIYVTDTAAGVRDDTSRQADDLRFGHDSTYFLTIPTDGTRTVHVTVTDAHDPSIVIFAANPLTLGTGRAYSIVTYRKLNDSYGLSAYEEHVD